MFKKFFLIRKSFFPAAAFTLLEMIVSISIIAIVASLFIANYRTGNKRADITMAAQGIVADFHLAQNKTLGLVKYSGAVPLGGWGLSFNTAQNSYTLFADSQGPETGGYGYMTYDSSHIEGQVVYGARTTTFPAGIRIESLKMGENFATLTDAGSRVDVTFLPPDPKTNIYRVDLSATSSLLEITLRESLNNTAKTIRVSFLGLAEVVD